MAERAYPAVQWVESADDLGHITFDDDIAEIEVPIEAIDLIPFKNAWRGDSRRLRQVADSIRRNGYNNAEPIIVRLGRRGRWVIVDGGHRLTAAQKVAKEFWTNLFGRKVRTIRFILFRTPLSLTRIGIPEDEDEDDVDDMDDQR